jgi:hypothetical protein
MRKSTGILLALALLCTTAFAADEAPLLTGRQPWRKHYTFFPPRITVAAAKAEGLPTDPAARSKALAGRFSSGMNTPPPPANWMQPDFDDADWYLSPAREFGTGDNRIRSAPPVYVRSTDPFVPEVGLVCVRGRFRADRAEIKSLKLTMVYRGGFVAYLNGTEIARAHLPSGKLAYDAGAEPYDLDAFRVIDEKGKPQGLNWYKHRDKKYLPHWAKRERTFAGAVDPKLLRDGVNVLALELHRSEYPQVTGGKVRKGRSGLGFAGVGLATLSLTAEGGTTKPAAPPVRLQTRPIWQAVFVRETETPEDPLRPIRIAAACNGRFSGQIAVRSDEPIEDLQAGMSALAATRGGARIPADAVTVRYAAVNPVQRGGDVHYAWLARIRTQRLDALVRRPPEEARTVAVWATVHVPRDTPAGAYRGTLTVRAKGLEPTPVPVELSVADWTVPDVKDWVSIFFAYQSPDTLAKYYKVPLWSDRHWKLIEASLKLLGEAGNAGLVFPLLAESCKGNAESMVYWVRKADGTYDFDYSLFDRYLAAALKHHDPPRIKVAALIAYGSQIYLSRKDPGANLMKATPEERTEAAYGAKVTVLDPKSGTQSAVRLPDFGLPEGITPWKTLLPAVCDRLKQKGLGGATMIGMSEDMAPMPQYVGATHDILPRMVWFRDSHFDRRDVRWSSGGKKGDVPVGCNAIVWAGTVPDPAKKRHYGWRHDPKHLVLSFNRPGVTHLHLHDMNGFPRPWCFRMWMEVTLAYGRNGVGRVGADYFRIRRRGRTLYNSYSGAYSRGATNLTHTTCDLLAPGPDGPVASVRFENARQGFQESEARIAIERALLAGGLTEELAGRCRALLDGRTDMLRTWPLNGGKRPIGAIGWRTKTRRLFDLAGEVTKAARTAK